MLKILAKWLLSATALLAVAYLYSGVQVESFGSALIAAFVIGLFNAVLRPVLVILTLPVTIVTVGLFLFVINALMFWAAASVLSGFHVSGFGAAKALQCQGGESEKQGTGIFRARGRSQGYFGHQKLCKNGR